MRDSLSKTTCRRRPQLLPTAKVTATISPVAVTVAAAAVDQTLLLSGMATIKVAEGVDELLSVNGTNNNNNSNNNNNLDIGVNRGRLDADLFSNGNVSNGSSKKGIGDSLSDNDNNNKYN